MQRSPKQQRNSRQADLAPHSLWQDTARSATVSIWGTDPLLFIFGLWQMPRCYAIAIFRYEDYASANTPVLSMKKGILTTKKHVTLYMLAFMAAALMLTFGGYTGHGYLALMITVSLAWL